MTTGARHNYQHRRWAFMLVQLLLLGPSVLTAQPRGNRNALSPKTLVANAKVRVIANGTSTCLWSFVSYGHHNCLTPPEIEIDEKLVKLTVKDLHSVTTPRILENGATAYHFDGHVVHHGGLHLGLDVEASDGIAALRFRYTLSSEGLIRLTATGQRQHLSYFRISTKVFPELREIKLSTFAGITHSFTISEELVPDGRSNGGSTMFGPIIAASSKRYSLLLAYEHGSEVPDAFLNFKLSPQKWVTLEAVKGNYLAGQQVDSDHPFTTLWFEVCSAPGSVNTLASTYRHFVLKFLARHRASRQPYIFYNSWNLQERSRWQKNEPYVQEMNEQRMLREIDVAHELGVEVFVLDTGWYERTGDWNVSPSRFPAGLREIKARLDKYGMKLGLWFGPTSAAVSSGFARNHPEWRMSHAGVIDAPQRVWETEESYRMCLVSGYADAFADRLIELSRTLEVSYFKWDAIGQYGCDSADHDHGNSSNSPDERSNAYGFRVVQAMSRVADKITDAVPDAIIDFDVTEGGRAMGLGFLASGKYFLVNNGPYLQNYDVPLDREKDNWNLFFHQGQARAWICRSPLGFDRWIPSVLFLTHYFPDDPREWQEVNVASLILGQNGIWGDLTSVSHAGAEYIAEVIKNYKQVRVDITESDPVVTGIVSGSPEVHEKVSSTTGKGAIVIFATTAGSYSYISKHKVVDEHWMSEGVSLSKSPAGCAKIRVEFHQPGAKIVLFGVRD